MSSLIPRSPPVKFLAATGFALCCFSMFSIFALGYKYIPWLVKKDKVKKKKKGTVNIGAIFGMDVGGTLTKIVYFQPNRNVQCDDELVITRRKSADSLAQLDLPDHQAALQEIYTFMESSASTLANGVIRDAPLTVFSSYLDGKLHFIHFETKNMLPAIDYLSSTALTEHIKSIGCTGGGAHKFGDQILEELDIQVHKYDELGCLIRGMIFALTNFPEECYTFRPADDETSSPVPPSAGSAQQKDSKSYTKKVNLPDCNHGSYPYLVVNIGSGVSILKVNGPGIYERVSGTSLGGGTYWGLCRLLTKCATYEDVLDIAENGDASKVDMLVKDIYGGDYGGTNLSANTVASSFGKLVMKQNPNEGLKEEDLALALLMMITNNIGQIAHLVAQLHHCSKIFFVGSFLRHNPISCRRLAFAINFWSNGKSEAMFLMHEGYLGALGTLLLSVFGENVDKMLYDTDHTHDKEEMIVASGTENNSSSNNEVEITKDDSVDCDDSPRGGLQASSWRENLQSWATSLKSSSPTKCANIFEGLKSNNNVGRGRSSSADEIYVYQK